MPEDAVGPRASTACTRARRGAVTLTNSRLRTRGFASAATVTLTPHLHRVPVLRGPRGRLGRGCVPPPPRRARAAAASHPLLASSPSSRPRQGAAVAGPATGGGAGPGRASRPSYAAQPAAAHRALGQHTRGRNRHVRAPVRRSTPLPKSGKPGSQAGWSGTRGSESLPRSRARLRGALTTAPHEERRPRARRPPGPTLAKPSHAT